MNHRQRCEVSFIGRIIYLLILGGLYAREEKHFQLANKALDAAMEPLNGLHPDEQKSLKRRVFRMGAYTIAPLTEKAHGIEVVLVAYHLINHLVDQEYLELPEGSTLADIVEELLVLIDPTVEEVKQYLLSSRQIAANWLTLLQKEGYYCGVLPIETN